MDCFDCHVYPERRSRRACIAASALALLAVVFTSEVAAQNAVPAAFVGSWVPSKSTCESPVRVRVEAGRVVLVNGKDSEALGGVEMAGPGYFGPDYRGIMAVLITEFSGNQPATMTFNVGEKKGVAQIEFSPVMPGNATAQSKAYNARVSKLNLAKRFPVNKALLKKCPGS